MRNSLQLNLPPVPVESVSHARESTHPSSGEKVSLTALLAESCSDVGLQEKETAIAQGYDPRYWPRIKSGEKRAYLDPIADLPEKAQREFVKRYAAHLKMRIADEDDLKRAIAAVAEAAVHLLARIA